MHEKYLAFFALMILSLELFFFAFNDLGQDLLTLRSASCVIHCELLNDCSCAYCKWGPLFPAS